MTSRVILLGLLIVGITLFPMFYNVIVIQARIYYILDYDVRLSNEEVLINKVEGFNYTTYLHNYFDLYGEYKSYIDKDFVLYLKSRIENDTSFHWELGYAHNLRYYVLAENHSKLYLTYNNNTIYNVKDQDNNSLILSERYSWDDVAWYLNFTQIPYVYGANSTLLLEDIIFIKMELHYGYFCGSLCGLWYSIEQYLVLSQSLEALLIFIPHSFMVVS